MRPTTFKVLLCFVLCVAASGNPLREGNTENVQSNGDYTVPSYDQPRVDNKTEDLMATKKDNHNNEEPLKNVYTNNGTPMFPNRVIPLVTTDMPKTTEEYTYKIPSLGANPSAQAPVNKNLTLDYDDDELNKNIVPFSNSQHHIGKITKKDTTNFKIPEKHELANNNHFIKNNLYTDNQSDDQYDEIFLPLDDHKQQTIKHKHTHKKTDYDIQDLFDYFLDTSSHKEFYYEEDDTALTTENTFTNNDKTADTDVGNVLKLKKNEKNPKNNIRQFEDPSNVNHLATENTPANKNKTKIADSDVGNVSVFEKNKRNPINNYPSFENDMPNIETKGYTSPIAWDTDLSVIPDINNLTANYYQRNAMLKKMFPGNNNDDSGDSDDKSSKDDSYDDDPWEKTKKHNDPKEDSNEKNSQKVARKENREQTKLHPLNDEWRNLDRFENALKIEEMKQHMYDTLLATL